MYSVLPRNFITGDNVPGVLKKWGHLRKKWGHCGENDVTVIWRSKISFPSVYIINDHVLTINKQYKQIEVPLDFGTGIVRAYHLP